MKQAGKIFILLLLITTYGGLVDNSLMVIFPQFSLCCKDIEGEESQPNNFEDPDIDTFEMDRLCRNSYSELMLFPVNVCKARISDPSSRPGFYFSIWHPPEV
jgi:hypothetical protein